MTSPQAQIETMTVDAALTGDAGLVYQAVWLSLLMAAFQGWGTSWDFSFQPHQAIPAL